MPEPHISARSNPSGRSSASLAWALAVLIALITFAVYLPALKNGFVGWDDHLYVYENLNIRSIDPGFFKWVLAAVVSGNWHPLTMVSHAVDYALWGLNPVGHHLTSITLHALNTGLVAVLAFRLAAHGRTTLKELGPGGLAMGAVAALLFGLHPLHVESVAWVSERKDLLSALFFLLSLLAYLRYASGGPGGSSRRFNYAAALVLFSLALMSKPMAVTLPVVLLILDYHPLKRGWPLKRTGALKGALMEKLPFFALSAASAVITLWTQRGVIVAGKELVPALRIAVVVRGYAFYIYKMLIPVRLAPLYPMPQGGEFFNTWFFAALALLLAITAFCIYTAVYSAKKRRAFLAAWLYFVATLLPVIGLVQVGTQAAADRYTYLPSIGPFMLAGLGAAYLMGAGGRRRRVTTACVTAVILVTLAAMTIRQTGVWKDSITLWSQEINIYPDRVSKAYLNRGGVYGLQEEYALAIEDFDTMIDIWPYNKDAYYNRARAYKLIGEYRRAIDDLTAAVKIDPAYADAYNNRAVVYMRLGNYGQAIEDSKKAVELEPGMASAYFNLGLAYLRLGDTSRSALNFNIASKLGSVEARDYLRNR